MKIPSPENDTCNECWKYRIELGVVSRLENNNIRRQVQGKSNMVSEVVQELEEQVDDNSTNLSQANNSNNDQEVETYDSELLQETELSPPYTHAIENIVSKFKAHVDQYSEMRKLVQDLIKRSREDEGSNKGWSSQTIVQIANFVQNLDLSHFGSEQPVDIY